MNIEIIGLQIDVINGNPRKNVERMEKMLAEREPTNDDDVDARWIITPELFLTSYEFKHLNEQALLNLNDLDDPLGKKILEIARQYDANMVIGFPEKDGNQWYNSIVALTPEGKILGKYQKIHLFRPFSEDQLFVPGRRDFVNVFTFKGVTYGLEICYDIRFPELSRILTLQGAEIIFIPAQFPYPRDYVWKTLLQARAIENQLFVVGINRVGTSESGRFFGSCSIFDPIGKLAAGLERDAEKLLIHTIDHELVKKTRQSFQCLEERRTDIYNIELK